MIAAGNELAGDWATLMGRVLIQGSLAILIVWGATKWLPGLPATAKHWLWRLVYLKIAVLCLWQSPIPLPVLPAAETTTAPTQVTPARGTPFPKESTTRWVSNRSSQVMALTKATPANEYKATTPSDAATSRIPAWIQGISVAMWLALVWGAGVLLALTRFTQAWWQTVRLRRQSDTLAGTPTHDTFVALCDSLKLRRRPRLLTHPRVTTPLVVGCLHPAVILPQSTGANTVPQDTQLVLLHELTHVHRRDLWWGWLRVMVESLLFFNPLVWLARREWHLSQELACDETVVTRTQVPTGAYQHALLTMIELGRRHPRPVNNLLAAGVHGSFRDMKERIIAMNQFKNYSNRYRFAVATLIAAVAFAGVLPYRLVATPHKDSQDHNAEANDAWHEQTAQDKDVNVVAEVEGSWDLNVAESAEPCDDVSADAKEAESIHSPVIRGLAAALKSPKAEVRERVVEALSELRDPETIPLLISALKDRNDEVRHEAIHGLEAFENHEAVKAVAELLHNDDWKTRKEAIEALEHFEHPAALDALVSSLDDSHHKNRVKAIEALEHHHHPEALDALADCLDDDHWQVRREAAEGLGHFGSPEAIEPLLHALRDSHPAVRDEAMEALEDLHVPHLHDMLAEMLAKHPDQFTNHHRDVIEQILGDQAQKAEQEAMKRAQRAHERAQRAAERAAEHAAEQEARREAREAVLRAHEQVAGDLFQEFHDFHDGDAAADLPSDGEPFPSWDRNHNPFNQEETIKSIVESVLSQVDKKVEKAIAKALKEIHQNQERSQKSGLDPFVGGDAPADLFDN